tara:strand:- start:1530 stop:2564 length:1035 start_codon:yes stop_codon:yes gene_type:complete
MSCTKSSIPLNLQSIDNKNAKNRTGANSKGFSYDQPKTKALFVGNYRADYNKMYHLAYYNRSENSTDDPNAFRARPLKHWRHQYGEINDKQTYNNKRLIHYVDKPGGYIVRPYQLQCDCNGSVSMVTDFNLGRIKNENKVGKFNVVNSNGDKDDLKNYYENNVNHIDANITCLNLADPPSKAKKLTRTKTTVNENPALPKYFQTNFSYLQNRCKTFKQKSYNFQNSTSSSINNEYDANCCPSNVNCKKTIYKPNNKQFSVQGAVDSSSRIARLKLNEINKYASNSDKGNFGLGNALPNSYAYSGRPDAPFTQKSKYQKPQIHHTIYKGGTGRKTKCIPMCFTKK